VSTTRYTLEELDNLAKDIFEQRVQPALGAKDEGKFIAIDVDTGNYEIDEDDFTAVARLRSQIPAAEVWLMRAGYPATCRIGIAR
jgi:hypothetical protein